MKNAAVLPPDSRELAEFERANAPIGLLIRYARGRVRAVRFRLMVELTGVALAWLFIGGLQALVMLGVMCGFELLENWLLLRVLRNPPDETDFPSVNRLVAVASFFQALGVGISIAMLGVQGDALRLAAWVFLIGAGMNSQVGARYQPASHRARILVYLGTVGLIFLRHVQTSTLSNSALMIEGFSILLLVYMLSRMFQHIERREQQQLNSEGNLIRQKIEKSAVNAALEDSQASLKKREQESRRLALVAEHATDSVILTDESGKILWVNSQFSRITGYSYEEAIGSPVGGLLNGPETDPDTLREVIAANMEKRPYKGHILNYCKNGSTVWMEVSLTPVFNENGEFQMFISVERDATEMIEYNKQLASALVAAEQADTAKSEFLARMSHELQTPINAISGGVELLEETRLDATQTPLLEILQSGSKRMSEIVKSILSYYDLADDTVAISVTEFDLGQEITDIIREYRPLARAKNVQGPVLNLPENGSLVVRSDRGLIHKLLDALIGNAVKFTETGSVTVNLRVVVIQKQIEVQIDVLDTGIGIPEDVVKTMYDPFTQADEKDTRQHDGAGLGLSIARSSVRKLGGSLQYTPEISGGSRFRVTLLLESVNNNTAAAPAELHWPKGKTLLVAEDNRTNRLLIGRYFKDTPMDIEYAEDGVQAIEKYVKLKPDVVLMDISMPNKNGLQATEDIRRYEKTENLPQCPILALTANTFEKDRNNCMKAGMNDFLSKPVKKKVLLLAINDTLNGTKHLG